MRLPSVAPLPGQPMTNVFRWLTTTQNAFNNGFSGRAPEVLQGYQRAAVQAADSLSFMFSPDDVDRMVRTRTYWLLMSMVATPENEPVIHDLVRTESRNRGSYFEALGREFRSIEQKWAGSSLTLIAPDTNVYLHQNDFFERIDWTDHAGGAAVRLMVPIQVVRELDKHKNGPRNAVVSDSCKELVRIRASRTVKRLRELLVDPTQVATLESGTEIELIADAPDHRPGEDGDGEIIDRVRVTSSLIQRDVFVATADGGMDFAAKIEGLKVIGL